MRIRQQFERRAPLAVFVEREAVTFRFFRRERNRIGEFARGIQRRRFFRVEFRARGADAADGNSFVGQTLIGIVGAQLQAIFGARREHAIRLADAARNEIVDHHADIGFGAIENYFVAVAGQRRRVETCKKSLCRSLFVAGGAVDLAGEKQARAAVLFAASDAVRADRRSRIRWRSRAARTSRFPIRELSRPARAELLPAATSKFRSDKRCVVETFRLQKNLMAVALAEFYDLVFDRRTIARARCSRFARNTSASDARWRG